MAEENKFEFYLNQQGPRGRQGVKGDDGFSPIISVASQTATEYKLQITNVDGVFETPNLLPNILDAGGAVLQFDRENNQYFVGDLPRASEGVAGLVTKASEEEIRTLEETNSVISPIDVYTIAGNIIKPDSSNVHISIDEENKQIKISVDTPEEYNLPVAAVGVLGGIMPDNQTIMVDEDGTAHANLDEIGNELNRLSNRVNSIDDDVIALDGMLMEAQSDILALNDEMTDVHNVTNNLDTRVTNLEQKEIPDGVYTNTNLTSGTNVSFRKVGDITYIDAEGGSEPIDAYTKEETDGLLAAKQNKLIAGSNITIDPETNVISSTGGGGTTVEPDNVTIHFDSTGKLGTTVDINDTQNRVEDLEETVASLQLYKFPNATIVGEPTINNGQISNFSTANYLQFPFEFETKGRTWLLNGSFDTGSNVTTQQNIIDSLAAVALAVRSGRLVLALSTNGTSFDLGEHLSMSDIEPNTKYYFRLSFSGTQYLLSLSTDKQEYLPEAVVSSSTPIASRPMTISSAGHPFGNIINLNDWDLTVANTLVWQGMDDVGISSRLDVNASNFTETGKQVIRDLASEVSPQVPVATTDVAGIVKPDGTSITIDEDGTLHSQGGGGGSYTFTSGLKEQNNVVSINSQSPIEVKEVSAGLNPLVGCTVNEEDNSITWLNQDIGSNVEGSTAVAVNSMVVVNSQTLGINFRSAAFYPIDRHILYPHAGWMRMYIGHRRPDGLFVPYYGVLQANSMNRIYLLKDFQITDNFSTIYTKNTRMSSATASGSAALTHFAAQIIEENGVYTLCCSFGGNNTSYSHSYRYIVLDSDIMAKCNCVAVVSNATAPTTPKPTNWEAVRYLESGQDIRTFTKEQFNTTVDNAPLYVPPTPQSESKLSLNIDDSKLEVDGNNKLTVIFPEEKTVGYNNPLSLNTNVVSNVLGYTLNGNAINKSTTNQTDLADTTQLSYAITDGTCLTSITGYVALDLSNELISTAPTVINNAVNNQFLLGYFNVDNKFVPKFTYSSGVMYKISNLYNTGTNVGFTSIACAKSSTLDNLGLYYCTGLQLLDNTLIFSTYNYTYTITDDDLRECTHALNLAVHGRNVQYYRTMKSNYRLGQASLLTILNESESTFEFNSGITTRTLELKYDNDTLKVNEQGQLYTDTTNVQEALELLNGGETTLLSSKADVSLVNTKVDLPTATGAPFPSSRYLEFELAASGSQYTIPAYGWLFFQRKAGAVGQGINMYGNTRIVASNWAIFTGQTLQCWMPVQPGIVTVWYNASDDSVSNLYFVYANGAEEV